MRYGISFTVLMACAALVACGDDDGGTAATAGTNVSGTGGAGGGGTGGASASGGTGGASASGGTGGASASGGTGGVSATGGSGGTGGMSGTGGAGGAGSGGTGGDGGSGGALSQCVAPTPRVNPGNACRNAAPPALQLNEIVSTLRYPVAIAHAPNDNTRLFVVERTGTIQIVRDGAVLDEAFLTVSDVLSSVNEQGLLGMAFDPNYATTGNFYVYFIRNGSGLNLYEAVLKRYTVSTTDPDLADPNSGMTLFTVARDEWNHNGGNLAFGPDGCLFVSLGDGGGGNDQHGLIGNGQDIAQPLGKILRIDADNYPTVAPGNLTTQGAYPHIWDYGLRNPWRFSFDRQSGDLYIGDVGQGTWEEVDVESAGTGKRNYGWRVMEGMHCRGQAADGGGCDRTGLTLPVTEYRNPTDGKAIIGGYVYRGAAIPDLQGRYFYADYQDDRIWTFTWNGTGICDEYEVTDQLSLNGPTSFGEDAAGELYVVTHGGGSDGRLYRIEAE